MNNVYILSAVRTPIGKFGGSLASQTAVDLGVVAAKAALERAGVQPQQVEETIFGNARQAGGGPNPARQISIRSGVPQEVPAYTVNKACASGIKTIALGYQDRCIALDRSPLPRFPRPARSQRRPAARRQVETMLRGREGMPRHELVSWQARE